jgi:hypothetical protein
MDFMSFSDELQKIAGHIRSGRRPISALRLLKKESEIGKRAVMTKVGFLGMGGHAHPPSSSGKKFLAGVAVGVGGFHAARKANEDRKIGRQVRLQQQGM